MALTQPKTSTTLLSMDWQDLETFSFGDGPDLANLLLELVLAGTKRATCWAESQGLLSAEVGTQGGRCPLAFRYAGPAQTG
jgi:uncharacterized protein YhfF